MSQQFKKGDAVLVVPDEGLDVPASARGKTGRVTGYVCDDAGMVVEYWVEGLGFPKFNAASYHIIKLPSLRMYDDAKNIMGILHANDPDLHERVRQISESHYRLRDINDATVALTLMWLGAQALDDNPRILEGSGINEV